VDHPLDAAERIWPKCLENMQNTNVQNSLQLTPTNQDRCGVRLFDLVCWQSLLGPVPQVMVIERLYASLSIGCRLVNLTGCFKVPQLLMPLALAWVDD
jgi:hypothetical protein